MNRPLLFCVLLWVRTAAAQQVEFSRDVLPILSANCFACHGPDEHDRKADLRLDLETEAKKPIDGETPVRPGAPDRSTILQRMTSTDPDEVMPPPKAHKTLKPEQIDVVRRWIAQGAQWQRHWAFEPVRSPKGTLDDQVRQGLAKKNLGLQPVAAPAVLARRLALDLIGLPPSPEMVASQDGSEEAYAALVDRLLASPQFGEHWARMWLDLARYADTKGYEKDLGRTMWPYRDWVVAALNADMPLDRFTREQLAGDLLPDPTPAQIIATAFHRNTMANDEGGTVDEEFRVAAVKDRVDTTFQVWMGLTMGCAKCHSHKYDPITLTDYYRAYAILNQTEDADRPDDAPKLSQATPEQTKAEEAAKKQVEQIRAQLVAEAVGADPKAKDFETPDPADPAAVGALKTRLKAARAELKAASENIVAIPVLRELPAAKRRLTQTHKRGNYLDPGAPVEPGVPEAFGGLPEGAQADRLGLARWLVHPDNPLTARVWANRVWARLFGVGIVETEEDFGALGAAPSNPALLDWLAARYRDESWSLKTLLKTIVLSGAYRQKSELTPELLAADPRNQLASRGARFRLGAEAVRDQALAVSGLLSLKQGGPSVMPPQPAGLWRSAYSGRNWVDAEGEDRYRRALYTYLKRTTPYPSFLTFDGGSGEVCQIRRIRTNTPLQALVTLNDPVYLEAAGALTARILVGPGDAASRIARGMALVLFREPTSAECERLLRLLNESRAGFEQTPEKATALLHATRGKPDAGSAPEWAAWTVVAHTLLNLDEFLTRN
jgi:mono/diheme cytochrome c family protein